MNDKNWSVKIIRFDDFEAIIMGTKLSKSLSIFNVGGTHIRKVYSVKARGRKSESKLNHQLFLFRYELEMPKCESLK